MYICLFSCNGGLQLENIKLCEGIEISEFDGTEHEKRYIVSYQDRNLKVSRFVVDLIQTLQHTDSLDALTLKLKEKYDSDQIDTAIKETMEILEKNGLFQGYEVKISNKKNRHIWGRVTLIPKSLVNKIKIFCFFFYKPLLFFLSVFSLMWIVYATIISSASNLPQKITQLPLEQMLICYGAMIIVAFLHELGHASGLMFCGEKTGRIGFAFYILSFIFFSDVTNAWKLTRRERFLVDYGGIYFQSIFSGIIYIINDIWIHSQLISIAMLVEAFLVLGNFNPFLKYDGYWMLSDLLGTTDVTAFVLNFWKNVLNRKKFFSPNILSTKIKLIVIQYSVGVVVFIIYFVFFIFNSVTNAMSTVYSDLNYALSNKIVITLNSTLHYIALRFSTYLILIFTMRLLIKSLIYFVKFCFERGIKQC